jgi:hypothetical protein
MTTWRNLHRIPSTNCINGGEFPQCLTHWLKFHAHDKDYLREYLTNVPVEFG